MASTFRAPTITKDGVKHVLMAWLAVRVLSSGFFGRAVTAAAAGALAFGARQMPGLVPCESGWWWGEGRSLHAGRRGPRRAPETRPSAAALGPRLAGMEHYGRHRRTPGACAVFLGRGAARRRAGRASQDGKEKRPTPRPPAAPIRSSLDKLDAFTKDVSNRLALSVSIDAVGALLAAFEPRWLRTFVGGAGWGPVATFLIQFVYGIPPLTALAAAEESGYINWARVIPTATVGWLVHQGVVSEEGLTGGLKAVLRAVGLA